jgi:pantoate--beta-alanine ligase
MSAWPDQTIMKDPGEPAGVSDGRLMIVTSTRAELAAARDAMAGTVAVVMTMGALHDGHEALLRAARSGADHLIVTVFVNPLQFGPHEDFGRYPRTLDADLGVCRRAGVDLVFVPSADEMYPAGEPSVRVTPGPLGEQLEGASRPGFFHGVLTVVLKLLQLTRPHRAYFGEKDYQQLSLVRRMVRDLDVPVEIVGVPTVREPDGLAVSSRNRYLSPDERRAALALSRALRAGAAAAERGLGAEGILAAARAVFASVPSGVRLDYLVLTDPELGPAPAAGPAHILVAAWVGTTRLIDNAPVEVHG